MELVYTIDFTPQNETHEIIDPKICSSISCRSILAFSRARKPPVNDTRCDIIYELCVVDMDKPWQEYQVNVTHTQITSLRWDPTGSSLLVVDSNGCFGLWKMKDSLLNVWEEVGKYQIENEDVLVISWLHNGVQTLFNPDSRDVTLFNEKFPLAKINPSVTQFGKKSVEGWIAVTSTGIVVVGLIPDSSSNFIVGKGWLSKTPTNLTQADVSFVPDGQIMIAASDGYCTSAVSCFVCSVNLKNHVCTVNCTESASFYLKKYQDPTLPENQTTQLTHLSFMNKESSDVLLACWGTHGYSCVEVWHLTEQTVPLNRRFQSPSITEYAFKTRRWVHKSSITHHASLTDIARPKMSISRTFNMESTNFQCFFACTYSDGEIKVVHKQSYQVIYFCQLDHLINIKSEQPVEKRAKKIAPHLLSAVQTNTGCGLIGISEGRLYLFRMFNNAREGQLQMLPVFLVLLLEYTMNTGLDSWDVLLGIRQGMVDSILEKLNSNFQKQSGAYQELLQQRFLRIKMALYSCKIANNQQAADCRAMITLHTIAALLKSCLRPKSITAQDKSPAERLASVCTLSIESDLDQMIKHLEPDDLIKETFRSAGSLNSLQSLQPFIQWISDFVLHILAAVSMYPNNPGALLLKDVQALCLIRELLTIIRAWGKGHPSCLPQFMTTVPLDPLAVLFRLITKAWSVARDGGSVEQDQAFMEECCNLPSKMLLPNYRKSFGEEMNCYLAFSQPYAMNYQFGTEPDFLYNSRFPHRMYPLDLCLDAEQKYDCVRHTQLGIHPREPVRECVRCRCLSLKRNPSLTKSPLLKAWELRFVKSCLCGGHWRLRGQTSSNKMKSHAF